MTDLSISQRAAWRNELDALRVRIRAAQVRADAITAPFPELVRARKALNRALAVLVPLREQLDEHGGR